MKYDYDDVADVAFDRLFCLMIVLLLLGAAAFLTTYL